MVQQCTSCGSSEIESSEGVKVCTSCGTILSDVKLVFEEETSNKIQNISNAKSSSILTSRKRDSSGIIRRYTSTSDLITTSLLNSIDKTCDILRLSNTIKNEMLGFYNNVLKLKRSIKKHRLDLIAGGLAYIAIKHNKKPLNLMDVSNQLGIEFYALGSIAKKMANIVGVHLDLTDLPTFVDRVLSNYKSDYNTEDLKFLRKLTAELITFSNKNQIIDGRQPSSVVCGCVYLAMYGKNGKLPDMKRICTTLPGTSTKSISDRVKEMKTHLVNYSSNSIFLSKLVNEKNYHMYISIILKDFSMNNPSTQINEDDDSLYNSENEESSGSDDSDEENECLDSSATSASAASSSSSSSTNIEKIQPKPIEFAPNIRLKKKYKPRHNYSSQTTITKPENVINSKPKSLYRQYLEQYHNKSNNGFLAPPSFIKSSFIRITRKVSLIDAKIRLLERNKNNPTITTKIKLTEEDKQFLSEYSKFRLESNDQYIYEKLLLFNVDEESILNGQDPETIELEKQCKAHPDLMSSELGESDIPSTHLHNYLRTEEEKKIIEQLYQNSEIDLDFYSTKKEKEPTPSPSPKPNNNNNSNSSKSNTVSQSTKTSTPSLSTTNSLPPTTETLTSQNQILKTSKEIEQEILDDEEDEEEEEDDEEEEEEDNNYQSKSLYQSRYSNYNNDDYDCEYY